MAAPAFAWSSFLVPNQDSGRRVVCRAVLFRQGFERMTGKVLFEILGRFHTYQGILIDARIYPRCLGEALRGHDVRQDWDIHAEAITSSMITWLDGLSFRNELYAALGGRIMADSLNPDDRYPHHIPTPDQLFVPLRRMILSSKPERGEWEYFLRTIRNGREVPATVGAPSLC